MNKRLYSLFHKVNGKWQRQTGLAYTKQAAIRVFQSALINGCFAGHHPELRTVKASYTLDELTQACSGANLTIGEACKLLDKKGA